MRQHQMTTRQVMITTALAAVVFWVAIALLCWVLSTGPGFLVVSVAIGCLFAVGTIRHPWIFLAIAVALWVASPTVYDSSAHDFFHGCYQLGWLWGAAVGMISRMIRRAVGRRSKIDWDTSRAISVPSALSDERIG
jgi:hypothetical protein